jgi:phthiocerol/phenolphthiocerol synthesis type-I polyketide synthase E
VSAGAGADDRGQGGGIAVIGMSGRFPGAASVGELWRLLRAGESGIRPLTDEELLAAGVSAAELRDPRYVKAAGMLGGPEMFDAGLFGLTPREAEVMDPQQRVFLECAWEALEDAGHDPHRFGGWIGVYAGAAIGKYLWMNVARHPEAVAAVGAFQAMISNDKDYLPTQVSYRLNLRGPSIGVQTACSTSLVAVHLACQALLCFECDMALAGGVSISIPEHRGYLFQEDGLASPDGCCRTFDARAAGTIRSNGAGIVVLRRLRDALAAGDRVLAVIRGSAINNDGASKVGYTAPSVGGQAEVIVAAQEVAGVSAASIGYVEAHGTATRLGDPIEVAALTQAFGDAGGRGSCALGSIKSNLGHLDAAAGVAGLIKTVLSLWHGELPASLHYEAPNPGIDFASGPFYVNARLRPWPAGAVPRRAGVSAFGIGGTNAHLVLEEAPRPVEPAAEPAEPVTAAQQLDGAYAPPARGPGCAPAPPPGTDLGLGRCETAHLTASFRPPAPLASELPWQLLVLSARSEAALRESAARLADHLDGAPELSLADVAFTLQVGRRALEWRWAAPARSREEARERLREAANGAAMTAAPRQRPEVAFVLPALRAPRPGAGAGLCSTHTVFREAVEECCGLLPPALAAEVRRWICSRQAGGDAGVEGEAELDRAWRLGQPAHFVCGYALARQWMSWGVEPAALLGHGAGEDVAACLAGVLPLAAALQVSMLRGRLAAAGEGSGAHPVLDQVRRLVEDARPQAPRIPLVSSLSGRWAEWEDLAQPATWVRLAAAAPADVDAAAGLACLLAEPARVLLEVGPRSGLTSAVEAPRVAAGLRDAEPAADGRDEGTDLLEALGWLWRAGAAVDWEAVHGGARPRRVSLPTYPFERRRYCLDEAENGAGDAVRGPSSAGRQRAAAAGRLELRDWFHLASWKRSLPPPAAAPRRSSPLRHSPSPQPSPPLPGTAAEPPGRRCLIFADDHGLGEALGRALADRGWQIVLAAAGREWRMHGPGRYEIRPGDGDDHARLWQQLADRAGLPHRVLHLWNVTAPALAADPPASDPPAVADRALAAALDRSFYSLLHLAHHLGRHAAALTAQAPARQADTAPVEVVVFSNHLHAIDGGDRPEPAKAALLGPCRVLPQELDHVRCRSIDVELQTGEAAPATGGVTPWLIERCLAEIGEIGEVGEMSEMGEVGGLAGIGEIGEIGDIGDIAEMGEMGGSPAASFAGEPVVAWRGANRWLPSWEPLPLDAPPAATGGGAGLGRTLRPRGVYLITGGLGGVGLEVARLLAESVHARLVLCGRSRFPDRQSWEEWLAAHDRDDATSRRIRRLQELEALGAELLVTAGDVADRASMSAVRGEALARFGAVHGVFHAAGVAGGGLLQARTPAQAAAVLAPKVAGTLVLAEAFGGIDLMVLFSSLNALTGGIGQADYCSANAFQDSFAVAAAARRGCCPGPGPEPGPHVVSINWDAWREVGMAAQTGVPEELRAWRDQQLADAIRAGEGRDALARILAAAPARVAVATEDLGRRLETAAAVRLAAAVALSVGAPRGEPHPRPAVAPAYVPPASPDEALLAGLWQELLGIEPIGRDDGFFDLGGHSLLATQLTARIREQLGAELPLEAIFAFPTPALLAQALRDGVTEGLPEAGPGLVPLPRESRRLVRSPAAALAGAGVGPAARQDRSESCG